MNASILYLLVYTINMVMYAENGVKVDEPAQLTYFEQPVTRMALQFLDTTEVYDIDQRVVLNNMTIFRVSYNNCNGYIRMTQYKDVVGRDSGFIWFYVYCNHKLKDRKFRIDTRRSLELVKKHLRKQRKIKKSQSE